MGKYGDNMGYNRPVHSFVWRSLLPGTSGGPWFPNADEEAVGLLMNWGIHNL